MSVVTSYKALAGPHKVVPGTTVRAEDALRVHWGQIVRQDTYVCTCFTMDDGHHEESFSL